jgi:predicted regulator of Ras-like GTPase activity (Roadblock/LC7/MglB family)
MSKEKYEAVIEELAKQDDVRAAALLSADGLQLAGSTEDDDPPVANLSGPMLAIAQRAAAELQVGNANVVLVQADRSAFALMQGPNETSLVAVGSATADLNQLAAKITKAKSALE